MRLKKLQLLLLLIIIVFATKSFSFDVQKVADGIYVHFGKQEDANSSNLGDIANIGFIVGKKSILVVDTGGTPSIGKLFKKKIKEISNLPISHIVITHSHPDHYFGTNIFLNKNTLIVGHEKLQRSLDNNFEFYKNLQFNNIKDDSIKGFERFEITKKVKTKKKLSIDIGERIVEIQAWPSGHTDNDLSIYDLNTKTFWSENIFVKRIPSIRASVKGWKKNLEDTLNIDIKIIVPGHGPVRKKKEAISPMLSYFNRLINQTRDFHKQNASLNKTLKEISNENKESWLLFNQYHPSNVTKVYTELEWE